MKIAGEIVGNIGYNRAELTRADLTRGRLDPHSAVYRERKRQPPFYECQKANDGNGSFNLLSHEQIQC